LDWLNHLDTQARQSKKNIPTSDVTLLCNILLTLFKHARNIIQKKWQQRSIVHNLEAFLDDANVFSIRKKGIELLLNFVDIMQDNVDPKVLDLVMNIFNFPPFVSDKDNVKLPSFPKRVVNDTERLRLEPAKSTQLTYDESYEIFLFFFDYVKTKTDQFDFWWKFFKSRLAPILYPNECKSLELLNKLDDMGFTKMCPHQIHLLVLDMILVGLENPKKSETLYATDKDIYLFLLIFRQSFLLPTAHYESLVRMLKTYRSWICKDYFLYSWPDIMERSRNIYYRVFIDNLSQTFFMQGDELSMDSHMSMCYEVLEIFLFFTSIPERVEFETWSDLLLSHIRIFNHLIQRKNSADKYDQQFGQMLERTVMRNLFIIWIKAHPGEEFTELWDALYEVLQKHFALESTFSMWRATLLNLTRTMIRTVFTLGDEYINGDFLPYETEMYDVVKKNKRNKITNRPHAYPGMKEYFQTKIERSILLKLWHKMLRMYGDENSKETPGPLHTKKIRVLQEVITMLLDISQKEVKVMKGTQVPAFVHSPEANRMLEIFIEWLVEASQRDDESFADGRYTAHVALCRIFCSHRSSQTIDKKYLSQFYMVIHAGLSEAAQASSQTGGKGNTRSMEAIMLNSYKLFSYGYAGANMLIPDYVTAAQIILRETSTSSKDLRIAAIHSLVSIVCLTYFYGDITLPNMDKQGVPSQSPRTEGRDRTQTMGIGGEDNTSGNSYRKLRGLVCKILMNAVVDDRYPDQQIKAMWGLFIVVHKEINLSIYMSAQVSPSGVKFIIDSILSFAMHINDDVAIASHDVLVSMATTGLLQYLGTATVRSVVRTLCDTASSTLRDNKIDRANVLHHIYYTLIELLPYIPMKTLEEKELLQSLFGAVNAGLAVAPSLDSLNALVGSGSSQPAATPSTASPNAPSPNDTGNRTRGMSVISNRFGGGSNPRESTAISQPISTGDSRQDHIGKIAIAAEALLSFCLATYSQFPSPLGASNISSKMTEFDMLQEVNGVTEPSPRVHHFVFNGYTLVTVLESPSRPESCRFILRDITGRYCWEQTLVFTPHMATFKRQGGEEAILPVVKTPVSIEDRERQTEKAIDVSNAAVRENVTVKKSREEHSDEEDELPKLVEETTVMAYTAGEDAPGIDKQIQNLDGLNPLQTMQVPHKQARAPSLREKEATEPSSPTTHAPTENTVEDQEPNEEEEQIDDEVPYPHYEPEIDTDKTDMLEVLQHYVSEVFPECQEYAVPSVIRIPDLAIDTGDTEGDLLEQADEEVRLLQERTEFLEMSVAAPPQRSEQSYLDDSNEDDQHAIAVYKAFRASMSNLGYLSPVNRSSFTRLEPNHRFYRALRQLDKLTERETIKIGVIYVANGQESERKLMRNEKGSNSYNEFVEALGWDVDLATHEGFLGGLDQGLTTGLTAPYYANATTEVIFHVITKMPNKENDNQQIHKKRHVGNDNVHIVWSEHDRDYRPWTITSQFNFVHIVIYPLQYPLFRVQIHTKENVPLFGPLLDGMIVDKESLAPLVRMTAINANKAVRYQQAGYKKPYPTRRELINEIVERFKPAKTTNEEFLRALFYDQCYVSLLKDVDAGDEFEEDVVPQPNTQPDDGFIDDDEGFDEDDDEEYADEPANGDAQVQDDVYEDEVQIQQQQQQQTVDYEDEEYYEDEAPAVAPAPVPESKPAEDDEYADEEAVAVVEDDEGEWN
jgi:hypothetical protein